MINLTTLFPSSSFKIFTIIASLNWYYCTIRFEVMNFELTDRKRKNRAKPTTIPPTASSSRQAFINIWVSVLIQSLPNNILNESVGLSPFQLHEYVGGIVKQSPSLQSLISTNHLNNLNQALPRIQFAIRWAVFSMLPTIFHKWPSIIGITYSGWVDTDNKLFKPIC